MHRRGFTLIELLVVIAIIALLSSVVLASLNAARDKARIGAARQFAGQVERVAGDQAVGIWDFDECANSTLGDRSGYGNSGALTNMALPGAWQADSPSGTGCSLGFDGTNDYVDLDYKVGPRLSGAQAITVSAWVKPDTLPSAGVQTFVFGTRISASGAGAELCFYGPNVRMAGRSQISDAYQSADASFSSTGAWKHIVGVNDYANDSISVYVDGVLVAKNAASFGSSTFIYGSPAQEDTIGDSPVRSGANAFDGSIDGLRVFAKGLTATEIGKLYAAERARFELAGI